MRLLFRLISLAALPMIGLLSLPAAAAPLPGPQGASAANGAVAQVQFLEIDPGVPPGVVQYDDDDDDYSGFQADGASRCAAQFRSFEPETGYYTTYSGERVLCPYLQ
jgi:hypothetical protein